MEKFVENYIEYVKFHMSGVEYVIEVDDLDSTWIEVYSHKDLIDLCEEFGDFVDLRIRLMGDNPIDLENHVGWFSQLPITGVGMIDTSMITSMRYMFQGCKSLIHVPGMETSHIKDMGWMFHGCTSMKHAGYINMKSSVDLSYMFAWCESLSYFCGTEIPQCEDVKFMFSNCHKLEYVTGFNKVSDGIYTSCMFDGCNSLNFTYTKKIGGIQFSAIIDKNNGENWLRDQK